VNGWLILVESNTTGSGRLFCTSARALGLRPVMLSRDPDRYPYVRTDGIDARVVDTTDLAALSAVCAELDGAIAGVTSSSEYYIATAAEIARKLGRPHPDPDAILACRDKGAQRDRLRAAGLPGPTFDTAADPDAALAVAERIGLPVVVKPVAGSGSIGVQRCCDLAEVRAAAAAILEVDSASLSLPPQRAVVIEEYLSGPEYSVEVLDDTVVGVTRKHLGPEPFFVEIGHDFPAPVEAGVATEIGAAAIAALRALGLGWGGAHVELRYTVAGPRVVEVNPRLAGGMIPRMVQEATGVDMIAFQVAKAAAREAPPRPTRSAASSIRFLVAGADGRLVNVHGLAAARAVPGVVEVALVRDPGQEIVLRQSFQDRLGYVLAAGPDAAASGRAADEGLRALYAQIDTGRHRLGADHDR
jgi:biotin carboxylase